MDEELKKWLEALRQENAAGHSETRQQIQTLTKRTDERFEANVAAHAETRRHFGAVAEQRDRKIELLAEAVSLLPQELRAKIQSLDERTERGFAETQAMIKFSHVELDRRVRNLEDGMANLQARVERLESSTH